ncbi:unnamed protein product [Polarella glacialis]|uniref:Uncharacterized protein n=1 Tax=Polarella glacialis TaxID=89957 RepID=A0A813DGP6_POLGL|nr:unnamed protein product [Polarella glacialis]
MPSMLKGWPLRQVRQVAPVQQVALVLNPIRASHTAASKPKLPTDHVKHVLWTAPLPQGVPVMRPIRAISPCSDRNVAQGKLHGCITGQSAACSRGTFFGPSFCKLRASSTKLITLPNLFAAAGRTTAVRCLTGNLQPGTESHGTIYAVHSDHVRPCPQWHDTTNAVRSIHAYIGLKACSRITFLSCGPTSLILPVMLQPVHRWLSCSTVADQSHEPVEVDSGLAAYLASNRSTRTVSQARASLQQSFQTLPAANERLALRNCTASYLLESSVCCQRDLGQTCPITFGSMTHCTRAWVVALLVREAGAAPCWQLVPATGLRRLKVAKVASASLQVAPWGRQGPSRALSQLKHEELEEVHPAGDFA